MNIQETPLSCFGSYLAVVLEDSFDGKSTSLWLKSLRGKSKNCMKSIEILPIKDGKLLPYHIEASYSKIILILKDGEQDNHCF